MSPSFAIRGFYGNRTRRRPRNSRSVDLAWLFLRAHRTRERRIPATEYTPYVLASVFKTLTATGLLTLVDRGLVELAPAGRRLPDCAVLIEVDVRGEDDVHVKFYNDFWTVLSDAGIHATEVSGTSPGRCGHDRSGEVR
jgi:hypothetical protein